MLSDEALCELRRLVAGLQTEDGHDFEHDMSIWVAENGEELLRELDAHRATPSAPG